MLKDLNFRLELKLCTLIGLLILEREIRKQRNKTNPIYIDLLHCIGEHSLPQPSPRVACRRLGVVYVRTGESAAVRNQ